MLVFIWRTNANCINLKRSSKDEIKRGNCFQIQCAVCIILLNNVEKVKLLMSIIVKMWKFFLWYNLNNKEETEKLSSHHYADLNWIPLLLFYTLLYFEQFKLLTFSVERKVHKMWPFNFPLDSDKFSFFLPSLNFILDFQSNYFYISCVLKRLLSK